MPISPSTEASVAELSFPFGKTTGAAAGKGHSSHALYVRRGSRRFSIYVPERLVPEVRKAIENGRLLQDLINEAGVRYVSALKNEEPSTSRK
jgi:hypothetical protein